MSREHRRNFGFVSWLAVATTVLATACNGSDESAVPGWREQIAHYYASPKVGASNLDDLGVAWEFRDFIVRGRTHRGMQSTPIVVDGIMYLTGPWSVVYALDAATGKLLWNYDPEVDGQVARSACCDAINRGVAIEGGILYVGALDGRLIALDAKSGKERWKADTVVDHRLAYTISGAPRIAGDYVIIGNGGADMGVRGYITAYDRLTGKLVWRFFTVPGDPKAGPDEHPEVTEARSTWDPQSTWEYGGGGTVWDSIVYDPDTGTVYAGTGNGGPHPRWVRSPQGGDNLYLASILAIDVSTGRLKWHYQTTPGESWDYTATQNMVLADLEIDGKPRKVIMQAPKNGFFYVLDRETGQLLSAEKYTTVTWAERVDLKTGRPVLSPQGDYSKVPKLVWPSQAGGHNWQPMAFSKDTGLVYIPVLESAMVYSTNRAPLQPASYNNRADAYFPRTDQPASESDADPLFKEQPRPKYNSVLVAWNPVTQKQVWASKPLPYWSGGAMALANGIVVHGSSDGLLTFYDARTGKVLRSIAVGTAIMASPMSYTMNGEQYIAITAGYGGANLGSYDPGSAPHRYQNSERLIVFKLGGGLIKLPPKASVQPYQTAPARYRGGTALVGRGEALFNRNCAVCHGGPDTVGGYPNLWKLTPETHDAFEGIVLEGAYSYAGMPRFSDILSKTDVQAIHAYLSEPVANGGPAKRKKSGHGGG